ncbi:RNA polymerase sigma factor SigY [Clostridium homopropionicum DSM 5847]|uniref:RNA polymerase sigma factor SigY n=1 Tax=Clostridium homopropionicum DSM 5847 TaxID=1121318 RepID=A0A0L6ZCF0_9CLOT|nr:RNA polymerase sigma factor SigY [Clostridium homopropionicum]KOA20627.1 RNA polymerase sigma factor SigY [Clostridium homopropionicum DSM 5847]SFF92813.1 RNA polymerase, sigma subunit, SigY [Clostridium homopropionicum]
MDELEVIERAKQGNKSALNNLLIDNYSILKGYIIKITGNPEIAQDVVQEALLKAALNIKKYTPKAKFSTWLIAIGTNVYRDMLRREKRLVSMEEVNSSGDYNVEDSVISKVEFNQVIKIIQKMPYEKRAVFILKHYYNYKYEEIAEILGCPIGTVRSRLHHCIKSIIAELERR